MKHRRNDSLSGYNLLQYPNTLSNKSDNNEWTGLCLTRTTSTTVKII